MAIFTGAGVNYEEFAKLIDFQIDNQTDSIIVCGTTGESATLSEEEHSEVIRFCIKHVNGRVPVIAGTGSNCTATAVKLSKEAEEAGADGLLVVTPYYNKATQNGLIAHYTEIANAVNIPIIMYNVPSRTGCNILPATAAKLFKEVDNIVGIKEASGDISQVATLMALTNGEIDLYSGNDDQIVPIMSLGGKGVISVLSNIAPRQTHEIVMDYVNGDVKSSCRKQLEAIELVKALFCEVNPIPVKEAANLMGFNAGVLRMPLTQMEPKNVEVLKNAMKNYGLI